MKRAPVGPNSVALSVNILKLAPKSLDMQASDLWDFFRQAN